MRESDPSYGGYPGRRGPGYVAVFFIAGFTSLVVSAATVYGFSRFGGQLQALAVGDAAPSGPTRVPNVTGMAAESADELLAARGLRYVVKERRADSSAPPGTVIEQSPLSKSRVPAGEEIEVVVSTGLDRSEVPDVLGIPLDEAQTELERLGLTAGSILEVDSGEPGMVAAITPAPGTELEWGSSVSLSVGSPKVAVPRLDNVHIRDARERLKKAGLAVGDVSEIYNRRRRGNVVLRQDPEGGAHVALGTVVDLVINQGD